MRGSMNVKLNKTVNISSEDSFVGFGTILSPPSIFCSCNMPNKLKPSLPPCYFTIHL